jgi:hypothetical protein
VCRGLFFEAKDTAAHKAWHEANRNVDGLFERMPCVLATQAFEARYQFNPTCHECGEDLCPCQDCTAHHDRECQYFQQVNDLIALDRELDADRLADAIVAARGGDALMVKNLELVAEDLGDY